MRTEVNPVSRLGFDRFQCCSRSALSLFSGLQCECYDLNWVIATQTKSNILSPIIIRVGYCMKVRSALDKMSHNDNMRVLKKICIQSILCICNAPGNASRGSQRFIKEAVATPCQDIEELWKSDGFAPLHWPIKWLVEEVWFCLSIWNLPSTLRLAVVLELATW